MSRSYFDPDDMEYVTFDIETTGFAATDELTTVTIHLGENVVEGDDGDFTADADFLSFVRTDSPSDPLLREDELETQSGLEVDVRTVDSEEGLFDLLDAVVESYFTSSTVVVAHNGETYRGSFDLGFLRRRAEVYERPHPFKGYKYFDSQEPLNRERINTTKFTPYGLNKSPSKSLANYLALDDSGTSNEISERIDAADPDFEKVEAWADEYNDGDIPKKHVTGLDDVYESLPNTDPVDYDPFDDSGKCVEAWEDGDIEAIALHNLADVYQTRQILDTLLRQVSPKELQPTRL